MGLFNLRRRGAKRPGEQSRVAPSGTVLWAVGDVHGQYELFQALTDAIEEDLRRASEPRRLMILLGDYVDRGLGSREVLGRILHLQAHLADAGAELCALKGNHEDLLLRFLEQPSGGPNWMPLGGRETLLSYGVTPPQPDGGVEAWTEAAESLKRALPAAQLMLLKSLVLQRTEGDFHFVHAGVRPGVPLDRQAPEDLMWIREDFLKDDTVLDRLIVHGHTPGEEVYADQRRICLDTGAYATGVLTALRLCGRRLDLLQARRAGGVVELTSRPLELS